MIPLLLTATLSGVLALLAFKVSFVNVLALIMAAAGLIVILKNDYVYFAALIIILCQVINEKFLPMVSLGGISLHIKDMLLFVGFAKLLLRRFHGRPVTLGGAIGKMILFFYLFLLLEVFIGHFYFGMNINSLFQVLRIMTFYLIYLFVINMVKDENGLKKLFFIIEILSVVVTITVFMQLFLGDKFVFLAGRVEDLQTMSHVSHDVIRISTEGMILIMVCFFYEFMKLSFIKDAPKLWSLFILTLTVVVQCISFYRSTWLMNICGLMLAFYLMRGQERRRLMTIGVGITAVCFTLGLGLSLLSPKVRRYEQALVERVATLSAGKKLMHSTSLTMRYVENHYALKALEGNWLLGIGMGRPYRPVKFDPKDTRTWIHNGYLAMTLNFGLIGVFLYFSVYLFALGQLYGLIKNDHLGPQAKTVMLTALLYLSQTLFGCIVGPGFVRVHTISMIALFWGCAILGRQFLIQREKALMFIAGVRV